jgi:hypothetical protein
MFEYPCEYNREESPFHATEKSQRSRVSRRFAVGTRHMQSANSQFHDVYARGNVHTFC